jgi:hypothetical protein
MPGKITQLTDFDDLPKVGIDEVRAAIAAKTAGNVLGNILDDWHAERLETMTLRRVIEGAF